MPLGLECYEQASPSPEHSHIRRTDLKRKIFENENDSPRATKANLQRVLSPLCRLCFEFPHRKIRKIESNEKTTQSRMAGSISETPLRLLLDSHEILLLTTLCLPTPLISRSFIPPHLLFFLACKFYRNYWKVRNFLRQWSTSLCFHNKQWRTFVRVKEIARAGVDEPDKREWAQIKHEISFQMKVPLICKLEFHLNFLRQVSVAEKHRKAKNWESARIRGKVFSSLGGKNVSSSFNEPSALFRRRSYNSVEIFIFSL